MKPSSLRRLRPLAPMLAWMAARYISRQRNRIFRGGKSIPRAMQNVLHGFFSETVLTETRLVQAVVPEPMVYPMVRMLGVRGLLDMSMIGAITLLDVVAYPEEISLDTLFHELVHVVQYRVLGLRRFANLYVTGFLAGGSYEQIPLEIQAFELGTRFERDWTKIFSVEQDVIRRRDSSLL